MDGLVVVAAMDVAIQRPCPEPDVAGIRSSRGAPWAEAWFMDARSMLNSFVAISVRQRVEVP